MSDMKKTKAQLIEELDLLRHRIAEMEAAEDGLMQDDDGIRQEKETLSLINALNHAANRGDSLQEIIVQLDLLTRDIFSVSSAAVYLLSPDEEHLVLQNLTLPIKQMRGVKKLIGMVIPEVRIRLSPGSMYTQILEADTPKVTNDPSVIQQMMTECTESKTLQKLVPAISRFLGYRSVMSVPLILNDKTIGLMDMSRQEPFSESDLARFEIIAEQLTAILRRRHTEESLHRSLDETSHSRRLLLALNRAAQNVQRAHTPETVYHAISEQAAGLGFNITVFGLSKERKHLIVSHLTLNSDLVRAAEKLTGLSAKGYRFPLVPGGFFQQIIDGEETVFTQLDNKPFAETLPRRVRPQAGKLAELIAWNQSIIAPLAIDGEVQDLLVVTGDDLTASDVPAITAFANQAAIAIENARLFNETQELAAFNENIIQSMAEGIVLLNSDGNFTFVNPAAAMMLGYTPDEMMGMRWTTIVPPDQRPIAQDADERRLRGETDRYELELVRKDGGRIATLVSGSPRFEMGRYAGSMAVFTDMTERKVIEEALRQSEQNFRDLVNNSPDGIIIADQNGSHLFANQRIAEITGRSVDDLLKIALQEITHPDEIAKYQEMYEKRLRGEPAPVQYERLIIRKDGTSVLTELTATTTIWQGKPAGMATIRDITERKRSEEEREHLLNQVRARSLQVQQIIETVPEGMLLLDADHRVVLANPAAERNLAVLADASVGDAISHLGNRALGEYLASPPTSGLWHEVKTNGQTFEIIARPMEKGPESENWVMVIRNVSQEREVQQRLQQQEQLAAVGQLAAGIAHDFNNIMSVIILYVEMALDTPELASTTRQRLGTVSQQAQQATQLIQQILDFSRRTVLERRPMDLIIFLREVGNLLERSMPESISLDLSYGMDEYTVNADPTRLQQVFLNLAVNARDAMPDGGDLRITLARTTVSDEVRCMGCGSSVTGEWVHIVVTDTGCGIPPDALPHVFEPFFSTKSPGQGTGLGLAQVYGIVEQHHGHLCVTSKMGEGTSFIIYLPPLTESRQEMSAVETQDVVQGQGETVLLVEDDPILREALLDRMELLGYRVLEAADGLEALEALKQHEGEISLVLSDLVMPKMGGQALLNAMRDRGISLPVVMLSGYPMEKVLKSLLEQGLTGWMLKPPNIEKLSHLLAWALKEGSARRE